MKFFMDEDLLQRKTFLRKLCVLGFPMILQSVLSNLLNFIDNIMVGRLGSVAIEAVSNILRLYMCCQWCYLRSRSLKYTVLREERLRWGKENIPNKIDL